MKSYSAGSYDYLLGERVLEWSRKGKDGPTVLIQTGEQSSRRAATSTTGIPTAPVSPRGVVGPASHTTCEGQALAAWRGPRTRPGDTALVSLSESRLPSAPRTGDDEPSLRKVRISPTDLTTSPDATEAV